MEQLSLIFDNGFEFSARNPQAPPLLTVNVPLGLQFGANPGRIVNQSVVGLAVQPGRTLALVGGEVALEGGILFTSDGRIELGSVAGNSQVNLTPNSTGYTLGYEGVENFQDIRLTRRAIVLTNTNVGGGSIQVQGRNVTLTDGSVILTATSGAGKGGNLIVNASDSVQVIGTSADGRFASGLFTSATSTATGEAGDITITTPALLVQGGALVSTGTFGAGKGGSLIVNASDSVQVIGTSADGRSTSLGAIAGLTATGEAGEVRITTPTLLVGDGAGIFTGTSGAGKGGSLIVNASDSVQLIGTSANTISSLSANTSGTGDAGQVRITTRQLLISDGASIGASTLGAGKGGSVIIDASQGVQLIGTSAGGQAFSGLSARTSGTGNAGNVTITTPTLLISEGAGISTRTSNTGKGGNVTINASESVQVIGRSADGKLGSDISASTYGTGDAGNLTITTGQLLLRDGAYVSADTFGTGKGGNLTVNASESVQVIGRSADGKFASYLSADTNPDSTGNAGNLTITTARLLISDGAFVSAGTYGAGKGGNLTVNASESVQVIGTSADGRFSSSLSTDTNRNATGDAGDLSITTARLLISDGALVSAGTTGAGKGGNLIVNASELVQLIGASINDGFLTGLSAGTEGTGNAGNLTITTARLIISDGAQVIAGTFGAGKGGNLTVRASEEVELIGTSANGRARSGLFTSAPDGGIAGDLSVETRQMSVRDGARVSVSSPSGQAGNLTITANSLSLNRGTILAETGQSTAEGGANITLKGLDLLRMDNESLISANALEDANGGNVTIDSTFIVATPPTGPEGSDITANAVRGNGGSVNITTQGLFGIEFRPQLTPKNDITVSSQFGLTGVFEQNTPGVDPSRGLAELPTEVVDATNLIDRRCTPVSGTKERNSFTITGRGGLPPSPNDTLQSESVMVDWVTLNPSSDNRSSNNTFATPTAPQSPTLTEAQGWVYGSNGEVILTAQAPNVTPHSPTLTPATCSSQ